jgi:membrane protease YdiL (CAAX protease family)
MTTEIPTHGDAESTPGEGAAIDRDDALRSFALFVAGTLAFSWGLWALPLLGLVPSSSMGVLARVGGFGPFVGALVALTASGRSVREWLRSSLRVRIPARWYAYALVLPPLFAGIGGLVHVVVFGASIDLGAINPLWFYPVAVVVVFLVGGGQEELGWRGFAQPALQGRLSAATASLIVGVVWALWHVPLFFVPGSPQGDLPFVPYVVAILASSVVLAWLYNASGSVLVPMLYHGGINPIAAYFPTGGVEAIGTATGYGSYTVVVAATAGLLLAVYGPRHLSARSRVVLADLVPSGSDTGG